MSNTPPPDGGSPKRKPLYGFDNSPERVELTRVKVAFKLAVVAELQPQGMLQERSADQIADMLWKLRRLSRIDIAQMLKEYAMMREDAREKLFNWIRDASSSLERGPSQDFYKQALRLAAKPPRDAKPGAKKVIPEIELLTRMRLIEESWSRSLEHELKFMRMLKESEARSFARREAAGPAPAQSMQPAAPSPAGQRPATPAQQNAAAAKSVVATPHAPPPAPSPAPAQPDPAAFESAPIQVAASLLAGMPDWFRRQFAGFGERELDPEDLVPEDYDDDADDAGDADDDWWNRSSE